MIDTFILYADRHDDTRIAPKDIWVCGSIYPTYSVPGLRVAKIDGLRSPSGPKIKLISPELKNEVGSEFKKLDGQRQLDEILGMARNARYIHWHIDPDRFIFTPGMEDYFLSPNLLFHCHFTDEDYCHFTGEDKINHERPEDYLSLVRQTNPNFFGIFEYYLKKAINLKDDEQNRIKVTPRLIKENIDRLISLSIGNCDIALLPAEVSEYLQSAGGLTNAKSTMPYRIHTVYCDPKIIGYCSSVPSTPEGFRVSTYIKILNLQNEKINLNNLLKNGKVFGVFESHAEALALFNHGSDYFNYTQADITRLAREIKLPNAGELTWPT